MTTQGPYRRPPGHVLVNLVEAGRDLVHGAAGARPGSRRRRNLGGIGQVSRWVGEGINWLLEDDPAGGAQEAPWTEPQSPMHGRSSGRSGRLVGNASGTEPPWLNQGNANPGSHGSRRRSLQVIPHPAPPLLQAAPSPEPWQEPPASCEPRQLFSRQHQSGSPPSRGRDDRALRPRPRSSRRIKP
ncbi:MAG: hypothetical protein OXI08_01335 [Cyanobacteria bacterium MAG IRC4_bin_6]|nr:hypothetical protein [Cyanobacteria bacterium MAG IRC4_bin_6]